MTIRERWFVDGWEFTQGEVRDVEYRSGQLGTPAMRGENATVVNRTGKQWRPKIHDSGSFTLEVWFGEDQRAAQAAWDEILKAVVQPHRQCTYRRVTAAGESRYCEGEVVGRLEPTAIGQQGYRASIEVGVPRGYWRGDTVFSVSTPLTGPATVREVELTPFAASTAPLEDLILRLDGAVGLPQITDITPYGRGETLLYAMSLADNQAITFNCGDWSAVGIGVGVNEAAINYSGERFLTVAAPPPGVMPRLQLSGTTLGANGKLTVSGYRSYLC